MPALLGRLLGAGLLDAVEANLARTAAGLIEVGALEGEDLETAQLRDVTVPVSSSAIRSIGYRHDDTITVEFVRGGTYTYDGSYELFQLFVLSPSKGQFFNEHFRK